MEDKAVFIVICEIDYGGESIMAVYFERDKAVAFCDAENKQNRMRFMSYRVEMWRDGAMKGEEV